jgi:hypothetical protein
MTKISQLADIGANLAADDEFVIRDVSDASTPNKKVTASGFLSVGTALGIFNTDRITAGTAASGTQVRVYASGVSGYAETTVVGIPSARTTISGYFENASGTVSGVFFPVVTQTDIGTEPNQVPLAGMLGDMAFVNYPFWRGGSNTTTTSGTVIIDGSLVERFNYTASMATGVTVQFSNLTNGREVKLYVRNTNATARLVNFEASTTASGFTSVNLAPGNPPGGASVSGITLSGSTGTAMVWVGNINGTIVGGLF